MKAVLLKRFGGADQLYLGDAPDPELSLNEVLIKVEAAALNRADLLQRKGLYPPPAGASDILGMEVAGRVIDTHPNCTFLQGSRVMALLPGGGYAEYVSVHKGLVIGIPDNLSMEQAAGMMEAFLTGWQALSWLGRLKSGERVLIHAGASGVGTAGIQLAKKLGAEVFITASKGKHQLCRSLGADHCIDYHNQMFDSVITGHSDKGVDLIVDFIGNAYIEQNLASLSTDGRLVLLGMLGGIQPESLNLAPVLFKRLTILGSTLRSRSLEYRTKLVDDFQRHCYDDLDAGRLKPVIDRVMSWSEVQQAHQYMEANRNQGKIILRIE